MLYEFFVVEHLEEVFEFNSVKETEQFLTDISMHDLSEIALEEQLVKQNAFIVDPTMPVVFYVTDNEDDAVARMRNVEDTECAYTSSVHRDGARVVSVAQNYLRKEFRLDVSDDNQKRIARHDKTAYEEIQNSGGSKLIDRKTIGRGRLIYRVQEYLIDELIERARDVLGIRRENAEELIELLKTFRATPSHSYTDEDVVHDRSTFESFLFTLSDII